jgi:UDP-3-O-[3-hydroxymyristoyl] glucosamine N-acyltransferase
LYTTAADIARTFNLHLHGESDRSIHRAGSLHKKGPDCIHWLKKIEFISQFEEGALIISKEYFEKIEPSSRISYLVTEESPRLIFSKVLQEFFGHQGLDIHINEVEKHRKDKGLFISDNVFIGKDVEIGEGTIIHPNAVIYNNTTIGKNCVIYPGCVIGAEGLGYVSTEEGLVKFPQIGGVTMGDDVFLGPNTTIRRGALDDTYIGNGTKIGSLCNVGHNCIIGEHNMITSNVIIAGSVKMGDHGYIGISASIKNALTVGNNVTIGQGAVVVKSVPDNAVAIGNPAESIEDFKKWSSIRKGLMS